MAQVLEGGGIRPPRESWEPYALDRVVDLYETYIQELFSP